MTTSRSSGSAVPDTVGTAVGLPSYEGVLADVPGIDRIQDTVDLAAVDPQDANFEILAGYFYLSQALGRLLHSDIGVPENATFLTFAAAWATESLRPDIGAGRSTAPSHESRPPPPASDPPAGRTGGWQEKPSAATTRWSATSLTAKERCTRRSPPRPITF